VGIYVDDIIYFSASNAVGRKFEELLSSIGTVDFMGQVSLFLGTEFTWVEHDDGNLTVTLTQQSFTENLVESLAIDHLHQSTFLSPYCSECSINSIPYEIMSPTAWDELCLKYQSLVGSLNWLTHTTRLDISTVVLLLAQHQSEPSTCHLEFARYVAEYLASTKTLGIYFTSHRQATLESFLHFPVPTPLLPMSDVNWVHKMLHYLLLVMIFHYLSPDPCLPFTLTYWVLFIGCQNVRKLLWQALLRQKSTPWMNVSSSFLNCPRY
jgi:hypothetical protein